MTETVFGVYVPEPLIRFGYSPDEIQRRISEWLVLLFFTEGRISSGKTARLLNISRIEFLALLRSWGLACLNYTPEELKEEFAVVHDLEITASS